MVDTLITTETKTETRIKTLAKLRLAIIISTITGITIAGILSFAVFQLAQPAIQCDFNQQNANGSIPCAGNNDLADYRKSASITDNGYDGKGLTLHKNDATLAYNTSIFFNNNNQNFGAFDFWFKSTSDTLAGQFLYEINTDTGDLLQLAHSGDRTYLYLQQDNNTNKSIIIFPKKFYKNEWHHIAVNWTKHNELINNKPVNDEVNLHIDGEYFVAPFLISGNKIAFPNLVGNPARNIPFRFGANPGQIGSVIGVIDEFQVYNYAKKEFITQNPAYPDGFFTYTRPTFGSKGAFNFILPTTKPKPEEINDSASIFASRNEYEPATFVIYSHNQDLNNVEITADDLKNLKGDTISKNNLDIRVVKTWLQDGFGTDSWSRPIEDIYRANSVVVPELLVYDDTQNLQGNFATPCQNNLPTTDPNSCVFSYYNPPSANQIFKTNIPKYQSKQIWLTVYVPEDAKPGEYTSTIYIKPSLTPEKKFLLNLNVLDNNLADPKQNFGIFYKNTLGPGKIKNRKAAMINTVNPDIYQKNIQDIIKHGLKAITTDDYPTDDLRRQQIESVPGLINQLSPQFSSSTNFRQEALKLAKNNSINNITQICTTIGVRGTFCAGIEPEIQLAKDYSFPSLFYAIDEPKEDALFREAEYIYNIHQQGASAVSAGNYINLNRLDNPSDPLYQNSEVPFNQRPQKLDIRIYAPTTAQDYFNSIFNNPENKDKNKTEYFYWQLMHQFQKRNRFMAGYYLWNTKMDGIMPFAYQSLGSDPYNDFDYFRMLGDDGLMHNYYRDQLATYPSQQGPIPTLEWENLREGIDDVRYLTTLEEKLNKLSEINQEQADKIRNEVNIQLKKYTNIDAWQDLSDQESQDLRALVANKIIDINSILNPKEEEPIRPPVTPKSIEPNYPKENPIVNSTDFFANPEITYRGYNRIILSWQTKKKLDKNKINFNYGNNSKIKQKTAVHFDEKNKRYYVVLTKLKGGKFYEKSNKIYQNGRAKYYYQISYENKKTDLNNFKTLNRFQTILYYYMLIFGENFDLAKYEKPDKDIKDGGPYFQYLPNNEQPNTLPGIKFAILNDKKYQEYDKKIEDIIYEKGTENAIKTDYQIILDRIYPNDLNKKYDQDGVNYWLEQINRTDNQKIDFDGVKFMMTISSEYRKELFGKKSGSNVYANLAYQIVLKRSGDEDGIKYLKENYSKFKDMRAVLAQSTEYDERINEINQKQGRQAAISELYETLFARAPDLAGIRYYAQTDLSIFEIKNNFLNSQEFANIE